MSTATRRSSQDIASAIEAVEARRRELERRRDELAAQIEHQEGELGAAVAGGADIASLTRSLRDLRDEREAVERGLQALAVDLEGLQADRRGAELREAEIEAQERLQVALDAIQAIQEQLDAFLGEFLPEVEATFERSGEAVRAEREAARLAGQRLAARPAVWKEGWVPAGSLNDTLVALQRYQAQRSSPPTSKTRRRRSPSARWCR